MCDVLVALAATTQAGAILFAKNSDRPPDEVQHYEWVAPRHDRGPVRTTHVEVEPGHRSTIGCLVSRPSWMWGAEHGVNEAGVAIGNTTVYTTLDPRGAPVGLTGMDLVRLALERGDTARAAVEVIVALLERHGQGGSGHDPAIAPDGRPYWNAFLVADPREAFVIDTSGTEWAVEQVADVRAISNRTSIAGFDERHRHPRQPVERLVDPRWHASRRVLAERPVSVSSLQAHLRSHDSCGEPGWSVCMHVEGVECTTSSMITELAPGRAPRVWALTGSPCARSYVEFTLDGISVDLLARLCGVLGLFRPGDRDETAPDCPVGRISPRNRVEDQAARARRAASTASSLATTAASISGSSVVPSGRMRSATPDRRTGGSSTTVAPR